MVDVVDSDSYHLERHASEYAVANSDGFRDVLVLKRLERTLPPSLEIDVYGWGPFKQLVLRR